MDWGLKSALTGSEKFPGISCWTAARILRLQRAAAEQLSDFIDELGVSSAKAQGYSVITSSAKFRSSKHRLFIYFEQDRAIGLLKVGEVSLFVYNSSAVLVNIKPVCVLDFFVEAAFQRLGIGKSLFEAMLETEQVTAAQLGYDRPSAKFLSFLSKHFRLNEYHPQPNGFVIFEAGESLLFPNKDKAKDTRTRESFRAVGRSATAAPLTPSARASAPVVTTESRTYPASRAQAVLVESSARTPGRLTNSAALADVHDPQSASLSATRLSEPLVASPSRATLARLSLNENRSSDDLVAAFPTPAAKLASVYRSTFGPQDFIPQRFASSVSVDKTDASFTPALVERKSSDSIDSLVAIAYSQRRRSGAQDFNYGRSSRLW